MNWEEFQAKVAADKKDPPKCGCGCGNDREPNVDGVPFTVQGVEVNSDCYYAAVGEGMDKGGK